MMSALEVRRKEKENVQSLVRRFTKAVQQSGILLRAREKMYKDRNISEEKKKRAALRRLELKAKYERLKKLGKI
jgi:ribosomal protein S21